MYENVNTATLHVYIESEVGDILVVKDIIDCCEVDDAIVFLTLLKTAMATVTGFCSCPLTYGETMVLRNT